MKLKIIIILTAFMLIGPICEASKQGHTSVGLNLKPTQPSEKLTAPAPVRRATLPGSGSVGVQRQGGHNSYQGGVSVNNGATTFFGGGWKSGSNQGMFGGINRNWKEEVRYLILKELGLLDN